MKEAFEGKPNSYDKLTKTRLNNPAAEQQEIEHAEARGEIKGIEKVAINMLRQGFDIRLVLQVTGFSPEELQKLRERLI